MQDDLNQNIQWEKIEIAGYGYKIIKSEVHLGKYEPNVHKVTLLYQMIDNNDSSKIVLMPGGRYPINLPSDGLIGEEIYYEFSEMILVEEYKNGMRHGREDIRYAIPVTTFERIK